MARAARRAERLAPCASPGMNVAMHIDPERGEPPRPIAAVAAELGLLPDEVRLHGPHVAKVSVRAIERLKDRPDGREILVTAITPTSAGEGKTTTAVGLAQALNRIGVRAAVTLRQPSLGPVLGLRGGASGGGRSRVVPAEALDLHLTGDSHAVTVAHNLAAALLDHHLALGNSLDIDVETISWGRATELNDPALERAVIGLGMDGSPGPASRETGWIVTAASEVMAVLALATDVRDLRERLGHIVVARGRDGRPVTLDDLRVAGAMTALLREAFDPNLLQTTEGGPAFVHCGPYAHIAHGNSSLVADRLALKLVDAVCTESGYGADLGAEKFVDIKCRQGGLHPAAAVLVATVRSLKMHGGVEAPEAGRDAGEALAIEDVAAVERGTANLAKHVANLREFGLPVVVAINLHPSDTPAELAAVRAAALAAGARDAVLTRHFALGGEGAIELARAVWASALDGAPSFRYLYQDEMPLLDKVDAIATRTYGADGVDVSPLARRQLEELEAQGFGRLAVCMAKTPYSLSHDPHLKGRPTGFRLSVREVRLAAGARFVTVFAGEMRLMPGLPPHPAAESIDVDPTGAITGLG